MFHSLNKKNGFPILHQEAGNFQINRIYIVLHLFYRAPHINRINIIKTNMPTTDKITGKINNIKIKRIELTKLFGASQYAHILFVFFPSLQLHP